MLAPRGAHATDQAFSDILPGLKAGEDVSLVAEPLAFDGLTLTLWFERLDLEHRHNRSRFYLSARFSIEAFNGDSIDFCDIAWLGNRCAGQHQFNSRHERFLS